MRGVLTTATFFLTFQGQQSLADETRVLTETAIFPLLKSYQILGKPSPDRSHKVVFALKQKNLQRVDSILDDVSDPTSANYGKYLTRDEVAQITMNTDATTFVVNYLNNIGVSSVKASTYGEYIAATAPVSFWETFFETEFVTVGPTFGPKFRNNEPAPDATAVRAVQYSLPEFLVEHVLTVLNTVQTPFFPHTHHFTPLGADQINKLNQAQATEEGDMFVAFGFTYPKLLNNHYHIFFNKGSGLNTQGVVGSAGQQLYLGDQRIFENTFSLPIEEPKQSVGPSGHYFSGYCPDPLKVSKI